MSTNIDSRDGVPASSQQKMGGDSPVSKKNWWIYVLLLIGVSVIGKIISESTYSPLWTQGIRTTISALLLFVLFIAGVGNAHLAFLVLILYIPFVDAIPGRFGGQYTALNLFNLISTIVIIAWIVDKFKKDRPFLFFFPSFPTSSTALSMAESIYGARFLTLSAG